MGAELKAPPVASGEVVFLFWARMAPSVAWDGTSWNGLAGVMSEPRVVGKAKFYMALRGYRQRRPEHTCL